MKLVVVKAYSEKKGVNYTSLVLDMGYRKVFLNCRTENMTSLCAELTGKSVQEFVDLPNGNYDVLPKDTSKK